MGKGKCQVRRNRPRFDTAAKLMKYIEMMNFTICDEKNIFHFNHHVKKFPAAESQKQTESKQKESKRIAWSDVEVIQRRYHLNFFLSK